MKILRVERAMEPCTEGGYFGYYFYLARPVNAAFVECLKPLGALTFMQNLKKPFYVLRGQKFVVRGQVGDDFCRVGVEGNSPLLLEEVQGIINKIVPFEEA